MVDLRNRTCSCRRWELNRIPCTHAVNAIARTREEPEVFIDQCYSKNAYLRAYQYIIYPINGENLWEKVNWDPLLPPETIRLPGRPKKARRKDQIEVLNVKIKGKDLQKLSRAGQMTYKCKLCKETGHNSRRCPNKSTGQQPSTTSPGDPQPSVPTKKPSTSTSASNQG